ncbi:MAG: STT3 domain-containing protein [Candidatus Diapherotrites archaeon]
MPEEAPEPNFLLRQLHHLKMHKKELFIVFLIFVLGFAIRAHLMKWGLFFEFDSYFHARIVSYILQSGTLPAFDPAAYYYLAVPSTLPNVQFFWYFSAAFYKIFTLNAPYDKGLWIVFVKILPALFGALTAAAMYFLGKETYGKKAGITFGVLGAVIPAFVYRTMAGFFEDDSLGFLWMVIGFIFLARAMKELEFNKKSITNAVLAAVFFFIMALTWDLFLLVPLVLVGYFIMTLAVMWFRNTETKKIVNFVKIFAVAFVIMGTLATLNDGGRWIERDLTYVQLYVPVTPDNITRGQEKGAGVLAQTVGEENVGIQFWGNKYNGLVFLPFLALLLIPYRVLRKKDDYFSFVFFVWICITAYMAFNKLKFTYTFGIPVAIAGGIMVAELFEFLGGRTQFEKKIIGVFMAFILLLGIGAGTYFVSQNVPNIENTPGWIPALEWLKDNTPVDSNVFNWWDEGHWISFMGERNVATDNRNIAGDEIVSAFIVSEDPEAAYRIVKDTGSNYIMFGQDLLYKQASLAMFAFGTVDFSDPRLARLNGPSAAFFCGYDATAKSYSCGGNTLGEADMASLPSTWQAQPNQLLNETTPVFIYRTPDNSTLIIENAVGNNTMIVRLWMHDPSLDKYYEEVYSNPGVKIWKVK